MTTSLTSAPGYSRGFNTGVLIAAFTFASIFLLHAETAAAKALSSATTTNKISTVSAPTSSSTNSASPALPSSVIVTKDDDDDGDSDTTVRHHGAIITIEGHHGHTDADLEDTFIPLAGIVGVFGMPVLIVFVVVFFRYRRRRENLAMAREYLNKGMPVPPELLHDSQTREDVDAMTPTTRGCSDRRRGIKFIGIGLGVSLAFFFSDPRSHDWAWGLILIVMGLGYLFSGWIDGRRESKTPFTPPPNRGPL